MHSSALFFLPALFAAALALEQPGVHIHEIGSTTIVLTTGVTTTLVLPKFENPETIAETTIAETVVETTIAETIAVTPTGVVVVTNPVTATYTATGPWPETETSSAPAQVVTAGAEQLVQDGGSVVGFAVAAGLGLLAL